MVSKSALRCLVVLEIALLFIYAYAAHQEPSANLQPSGVYDSAPQDSQGHDDAMQRLEWVVGTIILLIGAAAYFGLLRFNPWGRRWYVGFHALFLASLPLDKPILLTGWASLIAGIGYMVTGVILTLLFFTPLKEYFGKKGAAAFESAAPAVACATSSANLVNPAKEHNEEKEIASLQPEEPATPKTFNKKSLTDQFTDWLFPQTAKARAEEEPPKRKNKRRILLLLHYIFLFVSILSMISLPIALSGFVLVIPALYIILANLAQRKGSSFAALCSNLVAGYCVLQFFASLIPFMMASSSKGATFIFVIFYAAFLFLFLLEIRTYKFVRKYDIPFRGGTKNETAKL
jgi:hypothetical protein